MAEYLFCGQPRNRGQSGEIGASRAERAASLSDNAFWRREAC